MVSHREGLQTAAISTGLHTILAVLAHNESQALSEGNYNMGSVIVIIIANSICTGKESWHKLYILPCNDAVITAQCMQVKQTRMV